MQDYILVSVSPFYNGHGWTDHGTAIDFKPVNGLRAVRIDLEDDKDLRGIRNSIRLNHLLLLEGELPEMGEVKPEDANPAELTHKEYTTLLEELKSGGGDNSELESQLQNAKTELQNAKDELATANGQNTQLQATIDSLQAELAALQEGSDEGIEPQSLEYTKEELEGKTVAELQQLAEDENIELTTTLKADIIQEILDAQ